MIKPVKEISIENFIIENPDNLPAICQVLNINTKNMLRKSKMIELTLGNYYAENSLNDNASK
jgi:aubergine